jgi:CxxC motif-containing protein (DUF1111 family)
MQPVQHDRLLAVPHAYTGDGQVDHRGTQQSASTPYSDLLIHDMGPDLADGISQGKRASEFRTAPLWGLGSASSSA